MARLTLVPPVLIAAAVLLAAAFLPRPAPAVDRMHDAAGMIEALSAHSTPGDDDAGPVLEVVLWFRFAGLVDTYVSARSDGDRLYLPVRELFTLLRIRCEFDAKAATVQGFVASEDDPYEIDFDARTAQIAGVRHLFEESDFVVEHRDVYVSPPLFEAWFGLAFHLDSGEMTLWLRADEDLPITRMNRRSAHRPELYDPYAAMRHAPLTYDRRRRDLGGGTLDYGLSLSQDAGGTILNLDAALGAEVLGGDLRWRAAAGHVRTPYFRQSDFLWRYVREDDDLSQIRVGTSYSTGLEPVAYHGVHLTNHPAVPRTYFAEYQVAGDAPPDWDVELYLDDRLVGVGRADAAGHYRFTVPLFYGTSMLRVKTFGPTGEERQEIQRIQIPFNLLAPGEVRYNVHAGRARNSSRWMTQADVGYGINELVSVKAGIDATPRFESVLTDRAGRVREAVHTPHPYAGLTSRLAAHYLAGLDVSAGGYGRASFSGFFPSHASFDVQGVRFARASSLFTDGRRTMLRAGGYLPFTVGVHSASVRLHAARTGHDVGSEYSVGSMVYGRIGRVRVQLSSRAEWGLGYERIRVAPTVSYTVSSRDHEMLRPFSGMMVTARADYEVNPGRLERFHIDIAHTIRARTRLGVTLDAGLNGAPTALGFRLSVDLPAARSTTSARVRHHGSSITQSMRGSVVFDEPNGQFHFDRRPAVGRASAAVRLFIDENGDGRFNAGETVVDEDIIRLRHGRAGYKQRSGGVTLLSGLLPYTRYTAGVDESLLSNPMLVPSRPAFSFIADPNSVKPIDVPLSAAGIVEGRVMEMRGESLQPVPDATVRLVRREDGVETTLRTYSDGTYYDMGLPPGTYDILLESRPGSDLRLTPASHTVTLKAASRGDVVDGLDFVLRDDLPEPQIQVGDASRIDVREP